MYAVGAEAQNALFTDHSEMSLHSHAFNTRVNYCELGKG